MSHVIAIFVGFYFGVFCMALMRCLANGPEIQDEPR